MDYSEITNSQRAEVLVKALPYIKQYYDKIVVIKYGGNAMINEDLKQAVMRDVVLLSLIGVKVVLVHGGGPEITQTLNKMHIESRFHNGLRVTDSETAQVVQMVLAGKINKSLVNFIENTGGKAIGLSGMDGHLLEATVKDPELGFVGEITSVNAKIITDVLDKGYIPVVSTVAAAPLPIHLAALVPSFNNDAQLIVLLFLYGLTFLPILFHRWNADILIL